MLQMAWLCSLIIHHTVLFLVLDCFYFCNRFSYLEKSSGNSRGTSTYQHWGWAVNSFSLIHISLSPKIFQFIKLTEINLKCNFQVGFNVSSSKLVEVWPFTWRYGITFRVAKCKIFHLLKWEVFWGNLLFGGAEAEILQPHICIGDLYHHNCRAVIHG